MEAKTRDTRQPIAYAPKEISAEIQCSKSYVYKLISEGHLPHVRVGASVRVLHTDLMAFLEANRIEGGGHDGAA